MPKGPAGNVCAVPLQFARQTNLAGIQGNVMKLGNDQVPGESGHLLQRAYVLLNRLGGSATEAELIHFLFGAQNNQPAWSVLLASVLTSSPLFRKDGTNRWALVETVAAAGAPLDYVILHVEATGLRASRQRVMDLALKRFSGGQSSDAFASLINPERRLPQSLCTVTGINEEMCIEAPRFSEVAADLLEFIGALPVVAHDVELQIGFLNYELKRAGARPVLNPRIDILALATQRLPDIGKPSLERIAQRLKIPFPRYRRADKLVDVASEIYARLTDTADQVSQPGSPTENRHLFGVVARRPDWLDSLPESPGAYVMRDGKGEVLYVGKGKNLRERVATYYSLATPQNRQLEGLLTSIDDVEILAADTEEQALELESQLIREYQPVYNTQIDSHDPRPVIRVDLSGLYPRLELCGEPGGDGAAYFGPFPNGTAASRLRDSINSSLRLRTCQRKFENRRRKPLAPCLKLAAGECAGPCAAVVSPEEYRELVAGVVEFLRGYRSCLLDKVWQLAREAETRNDYLQASRLREHIYFLEAVELPGPPVE
ncbi:MAG: exonuclease domain-containing protein [Chloroflexi bacterium]|nr:exonuclease domain-containing protein [Chloroflexota bacterium]